MYVNSVTQAMIDRQMATPRCRGPRAGVNERLRYEAKARCILIFLATFNAGEREGNPALALFSTFFYDYPSFFVVLRIATLSMQRRLALHLEITREVNLLAMISFFQLRIYVVRR